MSQDNQLLAAAPTAERKNGATEKNLACAIPQLRKERIFSRRQFLSFFFWRFEIYLPFPQGSSPLEKQQSEKNWRLFCFVFHTARKPTKTAKQQHFRYSVCDLLNLFLCPQVLEVRGKISMITYGIYIHIYTYRYYGGEDCTCLWEKSLQEADNQLESSFAEQPSSCCQNQLKPSERAYSRNLRSHSRIRAKAHPHNT